MGLLDPRPTVASPDTWIGLAISAFAPSGVANVGAAGRTVYSRIVRCPAGLAVSKVGVLIGVAAGNVSVAVHRNTGAGMSAVPGTQAATSGAVACPAAGWAEIALGSSVPVAVGDWLALSSDSTTATFAFQSLATPTGTVSPNDIFARQVSLHPAPASPSGFSAPVRGFALVGVA